VRLPRDVDIRSGAFVLFAFVVVVTFATFGTISVVCRLNGSSPDCIGNSPESLNVMKGWVENIIAVLLALMAGTRPPSPPTLTDPSKGP
jgi:hypothetical protein